MPALTFQQLIDAACAAGFFCLTDSIAEAVELYNLRAAAGLTALTPQDIMDASRCERCDGMTVFQAAKVWLLAQLAGG